MRKHATTHFGRLAVSVTLLTGFVQSYALDEKIIYVCNNTGIPVSDLHLTFSGSGGTVFVSPPAVVAPGCPIPIVPSNGAVTNTVVIDWGVPCVPPYGWVAVPVRTPNGPLSLVSGFWTLGGTPVSSIRPGCFFVVTPPTPPPIGTKKFWANKWAVRCNGRFVKGPWKGIPGTPCWGRWTCFLGGTLDVRLKRCFFINRNGRLIETFCFNLGPWIPVAKKQPFWFFKRTTKKPPDLNKPGDLPIVGPPKEAVKRGGKWVLPDKKIGMRFSNDDGINYRVADDMISNLAESSGLMTIIDPSLPDLSDFSTLLMRLGPGYGQAGSLMTGLNTEFSDVLSNEGGASVGAIVPPWMTIANGLQQLGGDLSDGSADTGVYLPQIQNGFLNLAATLGVLDPGNQRFNNASQISQAIAEGVGASHTAYLGGLGIPANRDFYLWGLMNRMTPDMTVLANAMGPHIQVKLITGDRGWDPTNDDGAQVVLQNAVTNEILEDDMLLPVSDDHTLIIPTLGTEGIPQLRVRLKYDSFLSQSVVVPNVDGISVNMTLRNGDVDGNDAVNTSDLNQISATFGQGGPLAEFVPPTDINDDGIVDGADQAAAGPNLGFVGNGFFDVFFQVDLQGFPPPFSRDRELRVEVRSLAGTVLESHKTYVREDGTCSIPCWSPGSRQIWIKGSKWLAKSQLVTVGPGNPNTFSYALLGADIDDDNVVSIFDYIRLSDAFDSEPGLPNWDEAADLDADNVVSIFDYILLSTNFEIEGDL